MNEYMYICIYQVFDVNPSQTHLQEFAPFIQYLLEHFIDVRVQESSVPTSSLSEDNR